ncbi:MAG: hypothetical protein HQM10_08550 [Candidatus Riflebacteria bacterium]|nr:hypothetical protein [Candidatus Riflebacteria bacterium]
MKTKNANILKASSITLMLLFVACQSFAWGPLTHMYINDQAYQRAVKSMGDSLCVTSNLSGIFFGTSASPDIKQISGEEFNRNFHNDFVTVEKMIDSAKSNKRFGKEDVAAALGWAAHLHAEVNTTHGEGGYSNNKCCVAVNPSRWVNHQISELALDFITYHNNRNSLIKRTFCLPVGLLEYSMAEEKKLAPEAKAMSAEKIRTAGNSFFLAVMGSRILAEYLHNNRPGLIAEMDEFHSDRRTQIEKSVSCVHEMLKNKGKQDFSKTFSGSCDNPKIRISLEGDLTNKFSISYLKTLVDATLNGINTGAADEIFVHLGYGFSCGFLSTPVLRPLFLKMIERMYSTHSSESSTKSIVCRYIEGLLIRTDMTYPEILVYARGETPIDQSLKAIQQDQFTQAGLIADGRKPVSFDQALKACSVLESTSWDLTMDSKAQTLEKTARTLANGIVDCKFGSPDMQSRAVKLIALSKSLRSKIFAYQNTFNPIDKAKALLAMQTASKTLAKESQFCSDFVQLFSEIATDTQKLAEKLAENQNAILQKNQALAQAKKDYDECSWWNAVRKAELAMTIKKYESEIIGLNAYKAVLTSYNVWVEAQRSSAQVTLEGEQPAVSNTAIDNLSSSDDLMDQ